MDELLTEDDLLQLNLLPSNIYNDIWTTFAVSIADFDNTNFSNPESLDLKPNIESFVVSDVVAIPSSSAVTQSVTSSTSSTVHMPSSVPPNQTWPGDYDFTLSFGPQENNTKGVTWTYSKANDKLYVTKDAPCPLNFSVNRQLMGDDFKIRAQVMFSSPEYATECVTRCMSHFHEDTQMGILDAQHFIRCESSMASHETDLGTKQNSVTVPFENPAAGQTFSTYIFKFTCFGSCNGGPGRRPLILVLTLEKGGLAVGRRKLDIKICACPGRDRKSDEKFKKSSEFTGPTKRKKSGFFTEISETIDIAKTMFPSKKHKNSNNPNGPFVIRAKDKEEHEFLQQMKKLYRIHKTIKNLSPDLKQIIQSNMNEDDGTE